MWKQDTPLIDAALSTCTYMDKALIKSGMQPNKVIRCPLPYHQQEIQAGPIEDDEYFLFSGRFLRDKGIHYLERIVKEVPDVKVKCLMLVSPADEQEYMRYLMRINSYLGDRVLVDKDIRWNTGGEAIARRAMGVLIPSVWPTSTEYTLLEALGMAKPIVAFRVGVHEDVLIHEKNALVYEVGDFVGYVDGIHEIQRDSGLRKHLSTGATELFRHLTDDRRLVEALGTAYGFAV
jgi:glycosyltransferase involved in cell wall biosynthesis